MTNSRTKRSPGRPKTEADQPAMRDKVLLTASVLFMELGYEPVSINMIASKAGVTKASVYYYFSNKAVLFTAAVTAMMTRICAVTEGIVEAHSDLRARLRHIALSKMTKSEAHVEFESLMREAMPFLTEEQRDEIRDSERRIHEALAVSFEKEMAAGRIARGNPMLLSHAFSSLLMIGNRSDIGGSEISPEELSSSIVDLFLLGATGSGEAAESPERSVRDAT